MLCVLFICVNLWEIENTLSMRWDACNMLGSFSLTKDFSFSHRTHRFNRAFLRTVSNPQNASGIQISQSVTAIFNTNKGQRKAYILSIGVSRWLLPFALWEGKGEGPASYLRVPPVLCHLWEMAPNDLLCVLTVSVESPMCFSCCYEKPWQITMEEYLINEGDINKKGVYNLQEITGLWWGKKRSPNKQQEGRLQAARRVCSWWEKGMFLTHEGHVFVRRGWKEFTFPLVRYYFLRPILWLGRCADVGVLIACYFLLYPALW